MVWYANITQKFNNLKEKHIFLQDCSATPVNFRQKNCFSRFYLHPLPEISTKVPEFLTSTSKVALIILSTDSRD